MKAWDQFYPLVLPDVIGCPDPMLAMAVRNAAREFCERTGIIFEWCDPVAADGTTNLFDFDISTGQELVKVIRAIVDDVEYPVFSYKDLPSDWQSSEPASIGHKVIQLDQENYRVYPIPSSGSIITLMVATKPTMTATSGADDLLNLYGETIAYGAKARLMMIQKQSWTDYALAKFNRDQFNSEIRSVSNGAFAQRAPRRVKLATL